MSLLNPPLTGLEFSLGDGYIPIPKKDVGLRRRDGTYDFFLLDEIPSQEVANKKYPKHEKRVMLLHSGQKAEEILNALRKEWPGDDIQHFFLEKKEYLAKHTVPYTKEMLRAIAKNAFNYLAWFKNDKEFLAQTCFDPVRNFIRNGEGHERDYVFLCPDPVLYEEPNKAVEAHVAIIQIAPTGELVVSISFFNQIHWQVLIAKDYKGTPVKQEGHLFIPYEVGGKRIQKLGSFSKNRLIIEPIHLRNLIIPTKGIIKPVKSLILL